MMKTLGMTILGAVAISCGGSSSPEPAEPAGAGHAGDDQGEAHDHGDGEASATGLVAAEKAAFEKARPVFDRHCAKCHTQAGKNAKPKSLEHFDMTAYPFGGHHAGEITAAIRKVLAIGGGKATMPMDQPGAVTGDELALVAAWADAYDKAHPPGTHGQHDHDGDHHH